jgi:hypothetical protein
MEKWKKLAKGLVELEKSIEVLLWDNIDWTQSAHIKPNFGFALPGRRCAATVGGPLQFINRVPEN